MIGTLEIIKYARKPIVDAMAVQDVANDLSTMLVSIMERLNATHGKSFVICLLTY
jgi:hypothetical protein